MKIWPRLVLAIAVSTQVCGQSHRSDSPLFGTYQEFVWAEGMLRADNLSEKTELAFDTVTRFECYKHGGQSLVGGDAYCLQASAAVSFGIPSIDLSYLPVKSWGPEIILAASSPSADMPICVWSELTINLREKSVMVTDIKKSGIGHEGFNDSCKDVPQSQSYHLVDTSNEMVRRQIRAAKKRDSSKVN